MATLHGYEAVKGDNVFDLLDGTGTIVASREPPEEPGILVEFPNGKRRWYGEDGRTPTRPRMTLYWEDPVLVSPPKNGRAGWNILRHIMLGAVKNLKEDGLL